MSHFILYTDGGARGNPGPAALGAAIYNEKHELVHTISEYLGKTTNNQAEYQGLIAGLSACKKLGASAVDCFLDSELLVKQMKGEYRVKNTDLKLLHEQARLLVNIFHRITFRHIPREKNAMADQLVNEALDRELKEKR